LVSGATDIELYDYCKEKGIYLFVNNRIHLKTYLVDYMRVLTGSANLTNRGMGEAQESNYETLVELPNVTSEYLIKLARIKGESIYVQESYFEDLKNAMLELKEKFKSNESEFESKQREIDSRSKKDFYLISELPMSKNLNAIYSVLKGCRVEDLCEKANAEHDIATYNLDKIEYADYEEFRCFLRDRFLAHPFIKDLCDYVTECKRFGDIRNWVKNHCTNVPIPSSKNVTPNVQALYEWLKDVGSDRFYEKIPNHSQILCPKYKDEYE
jgi:hypothetical protein